MVSARGGLLLEGTLIKAAESAMAIMTFYGMVAPRVNIGTIPSTSLLYLILEQRIRSRRISRQLVPVLTKTASHLLWKPYSTEVYRRHSRTVGSRVLRMMVSV